MISYREDPAAHVAHITVDGPISPGAFKEIACKLEARIALDGKRGCSRRSLSANEKERRLGAAQVEALEATGTLASITFDDPNAIVAIETSAIGLGYRFSPAVKCSANPSLL